MYFCGQLSNNTYVVGVKFGNPYWTLDYYRSLTNPVVPSEKCSKTTEA